MPDLWTLLGIATNLISSAFSLIGLAHSAPVPTSGVFRSRDGLAVQMVGPGAQANFTQVVNRPAPRNRPLGIAPPSHHQVHIVRPSDRGVIRAAIRALVSVRPPGPRPHQAGPALVVFPGPPTLDLRENVRPHALEQLRGTVRRHARQRRLSITSRGLAPSLHSWVKPSFPRGESCRKFRVRASRVCECFRPEGRIEVHRRPRHFGLRPLDRKTSRRRSTWRGVGAPREMSGCLTCELRRNRTAPDLGCSIAHSVGRHRDRVTCKPGPWDLFHVQYRHAVAGT
jgi:hypothetical protein